MALNRVLTVAVNLLMNIFSGYVALYLGCGDMIITKTEGSEDWNRDDYTSVYENDKDTKTAADTLPEETDVDAVEHQSVKNFT